MKWGEAVFQRHEGEWVRLGWEGRVLRLEANSYTDFQDNKYVFESEARAEAEFTEAGLLLSKMGFTMTFLLEGF